MAEIELGPDAYPVMAVITELGTPRVLWQKTLFSADDFDAPDALFFCPIDLLMVCRHGSIVDWTRLYPDGAIVDLLPGATCV